MHFQRVLGIVALEGPIQRTVIVFIGCRKGFFGKKSVDLAFFLDGRLDDGTGVFG
jgi:hypothetical protein